MAAAEGSNPLEGGKAGFLAGFFVFERRRTAFRQNLAGYVKNVTKNQRLCA